MKKFFALKTIFKTTSVLILILVLAFSSCGIKQSVQEIFDIQNLTSNSIKSGSSCHYIQLTDEKITKQVAGIRGNFESSDIRFTDQNLTSALSTECFRKAGSVPLYILYQQLRFSLI